MLGTFIDGDIEWEVIKAERNIRLHEGVTFEEAAAALATDPHEYAVADATKPGRVVSLCMSPQARVLFVVTIEVTPAERTRIISARKADSHEQRTYAQERSRHARG